MSAVAIATPEVGAAFNSVPNLEDVGEGMPENDKEDNGVTEIESLCMNCHDNVRSSVQSVSNLILIYF
jgi:hypothetical protein